DLAGARPLFERALAVREKKAGPEDPAANRPRYHLARLLLVSGHANEAITLGETALAAHEKVLGRNHAWTVDSARVTTDAMGAVGRTEEAKALRERYGVPSSIAFLRYELRREVLMMFVSTTTRSLRPK